MRTEFEEGRLQLAAAIYDEHAKHAPHDAILLRARIYLNSDPPAAIGFLLALKSSKPTKALLAECLALLGDAYARIGDFPAADTSLEEALRISKGLANHELLAQVGYRLGRRYLAEGDVEQAREILPLAREGRSIIARIGALHLESFILSREGRFREQARVLTELLRSTNPASHDFMEHRAWATHSLAALTRELYLPEAMPDIERQLTETQWPEEFAVNRFQALRSLGWAKSLQGDDINAFRYLKRSAEVAPTTAWRVMAYCDRSYLARSIGQEVWGRHELAEAEELADAIPWHSLVGEEPLALLLLAELFAGVDAAKASVYLARFREIGDVKSPLSLLRRDPRLSAMVDYSTGVVQAALGNRKAARLSFQSAYKVFAQSGYEWRAGRCALAEYQLNNSPSTLAAARDHLKNYSASWLGQAVRATSGGSSASSLPPMQAQVFKLLCEGRSTSEIADRLNRSEFTIRGHIKALLKTFNVNSRSALIADAARRGLV
jgi:DNA-binding CsgD family transcriptional regulator/tetratricopeptide (TPR) repeat protein